MTSGKNLCPFCRTPAPTDEENVGRLSKRVEKDDSRAINNLGCYYYEGMNGLPQDRDKALELWHRAAELGNANSYCSIGYAYFNGEGVARDEKKAKHYYELAAMGGDEPARHNLGVFERNEGNLEKVLKHLMIAAGSGNHDSLKTIQRMCSKGYVTKDDYSKSLQAYQSYLAEIKSDDRDKAAACNDRYKYYE